MPKNPSKPQIKKPKRAQTNQTSKTSIPSKLQNNPAQIIRKNTCVVFTAVIALLFTFGGQEMSVGDRLAPFLMAFGAGLVGLVIVTSEDAWNQIDKLPKIILKWLVCIVVCMILVFPVYFIVRNMVVKQANELANKAIYTGYLEAGEGNNPVPNVPANNITLLMGNLAVLASPSQKYVMSQGGIPFLTIGVDSQGFMTLNTQVLDSNGNNIVKIIGNEFHANPNDFYCSQPNPHSVIVKDTAGNQVLDIDFINSKTMSILGTFYLSGYSHPVIISSNLGIIFPNGSRVSNMTIDMTKSQGGLIDFPKGGS